MFSLVFISFLLGSTAAVGYNPYHHQEPSYSPSYPPHFPSIPHFGSPFGYPGSFPHHGYSDYYPSHENYGAPNYGEYGGYYGFPGFDKTRGTYPHAGYPGKKIDTLPNYGYEA